MRKFVDAVASSFRMSNASRTNTPIKPSVDSIVNVEKVDGVTIDIISFTRGSVPGNTSNQ